MVRRMNRHERLLQELYAALDAHDGERMARCYSPDATFSDPVFQSLRGAEVGNMWRMLCERGKDLRVTASGIHANDTTGGAHWEARYTFSASGRPVLNVIDASFTFKDGLIATHVDRFDLWAWTRQALGLPGLLLGWSPLLQGQVRGKARAGLAAYSARR